MSADAEFVVRLTTASLQAARSGQDPPALVRAGDDEVALLAALRAHRLVMHVTPYAGALGLSTATVEALRAQRLRQLQAGLANVADLVGVSAALDEAGIAHLFVKGAALAVVLGRQPALRGGGDIDVWIRPEAAIAAEDTLAAAGWRRVRVGPALPPTAQPLIRRVWKEIALVRAGHPTVDLHWRLVENETELDFRFDEALAASVPVPAIGPTVRTLCTVHALQHVAAHGRQDLFATLRHLVDVAELAERCDPDTLWGVAATNRSVRLAVITATHVAPWLAGTVPVDRATTEAGRRAWASCLSLANRQQVHNAKTGPSRVVSIIGREAWNVRTGPKGARVLPQTGRFALKLVCNHRYSPLRPLARRFPGMRRWYWADLG